MSVATATGNVLTAPTGEAVGLVRLHVDSIRPSPVNSNIYRPVTPDDPQIIELARSIGKNGLLQPLTVSQDLYIINGHRRHMACRLAGLESVPCEVRPITLDDPQFLTLLREANRQRVKSFDEIIREQVVDVDPKLAYRALLQHRKEACAVSGDRIHITGKVKRKAISDAKREMLDRAIEIINAQQEYWPLSDRSIHYDVLNDPPLRHSSKPSSRYRNDKNCYKDLTDLLTRARLTGEIPFDAIEDPTRTVNVWSLFDGVEGFVDRELSHFLAGYARDLQRSQPNHLEIIGEKNTVEGSIRHVAMEYCIPYTIGRGYCSLDPRHKMYKRFKASGKDQLIILVLSDFDPDGLRIAHGFARSMRDDFGIKNIHPRSVCLTWGQVQERQLAQTFDISEDKKKTKKFREHLEEYGEHCHELEALPSAERSRLLEEAIRGVLDIDAYNAEVEAEKEDAARIEGLRRSFGPMLRNALKKPD
jgi:hypothetical protein